MTLEKDNLAFPMLAFFCFDEARVVAQFEMFPIYQPAVLCVLSKVPILVVEEFSATTSSSSSSSPSSAYPEELFTRIFDHFWSPF